MSDDPFGGAVRDLLSGKNRGFPAPKPGKIVNVTAAEPNSYGIPVTGAPLPIGRAPDDFCQSLWTRLASQQPGTPEYISTVSEIDKYCGLPPGAKPTPPKPEETDACREARRKFRNQGTTGYGDQYEAARLMHEAKRACGGSQ